MPNNIPKLYTLAQAAELLDGVSPETLRKQAQKDPQVLEAVLVGKTWVTTAAAIDAYRRDHLGRRTGGRKPKGS